jgi:hypothetical protein
MFVSYLILSALDDLAGQVAGCNKSSLNNSIALTVPTGKAALLTDFCLFFVTERRFNPSPCSGNRQNLPRPRIIFAGITGKSPAD